MPDILPEKAKEILKDKSVRGNPLTAKQKGFFGAIAEKAPSKRSGQSKALSSRMKK